MRKELDKIIAARIVRPVSFAWPFPVVIATKKYSKPCFCVDYRTLNQRTNGYHWPLLKSEGIFDALKGATVFKSLDILSSYWKARLEESYKDKISFVYRYGTFQLEFMPFGLMNTPSTFQRMIDRVLADLEFA